MRLMEISFKIIKFNDSLGLESSIIDIDESTNNYYKFKKLRDIIVCLKPKALY